MIFTHFLTLISTINSIILGFGLFFLFISSGSCIATHNDMKSDFVLDTDHLDKLQSVISTHEAEMGIKSIMEAKAFLNPRLQVSIKRKFTSPSLLGVERNRLYSGLDAGGETIRRYFAQEYRNLSYYKLSVSKLIRIKQLQEEKLSAQSLMLSELEEKNQQLHLSKTIIVEENKGRDAEITMRESSSDDISWQQFWEENKKGIKIGLAVGIPTVLIISSIAQFINKKFME